MNALSVVMGFLLLFGISSFSIHQQVSLVEGECARVLGAYRLNQEERKVQAQKLYKKHVHKKKDMSEKKAKEVTYKKKQRAGFYTSPRRKDSIEDAGKFNLQIFRKASLTPEQVKFLERGVQRLLQVLYKDTSFYTVSFPRQFSSIIVEAIQNDSSIVSCERLYQMVAKFPGAYKAFRGTTVYNVEKGLGIPPFSDFFTFQPQDCVVAFPVAQEQVLKALLSSEMVKKIFLAEEAKWREGGRKVALTKRELLSLGGQEGGDFSQLLLFLQFHKGVSGHSVCTLQDKGTKLTRKIKVAK